MARIRSVKPELFTHEGLYEAEIDYKLPIRLAFIGLFTCCDRKGRFRWQPRRLKLDIFPYDNIDFSIVLEVLQRLGYIVKYENQGELYGCIPSWLRHQHINNKEMASKLPPIEESIILETKKLKTAKEVVFCQPSDRPSSEMNDLLIHESHEDNSLISNKSRKKNFKEKKSVVQKQSVNENLEKTYQIFDHWKTIMNHPGAKLDEKRKNIIVKALKFGYGVDELCEAITGCSYTPHNMGSNDRGQRYDGLHVILRDGDQIDRFIHNYKIPPKPVTEADRRSMANVATLQNWISKKIAEEN